MKTRVYIDGYNLFYGCVKHTEDKWLDIFQLFEDIIKQQTPNATLDHLYFFTTDIKAKIASHGQQAQQAQQDYHRALTTLYPDSLSIIKGYYSLEKAHLLAYENPPNRDKRVSVWKIEEKQTDVNIALTAYRHAVQGQTEQVVFVSNDTDLEPALIALREDMGDDIQIGVIIPTRKITNGKNDKKRPERPMNERLKKHANWTRSHILPKELADNQLPDKIPTKKKPICKPDYW